MFNELVKNVNAINISGVVKKTYYDAETGGIEGIIPIIAALIAGKNDIPNVNNLVKNRL